MSQMVVKIENTSSGRYNVTLYWGEGENIDREIVDDFQDFATAQRRAETVAKEQGARLLPFRPYNFQAERARLKLVKAYRDQGFGLREALKMAQSA